MCTVLGLNRDQSSIRNRINHLFDNDAFRSVEAIINSYVEYSLLVKVLYVMIYGSKCTSSSSKRKP